MVIDVASMKSIPQRGEMHFAIWNEKTLYSVSGKYSRTGVRHCGFVVENAQLCKLGETIDLQRIGGAVDTNLVF